MIESLAERTPGFTGAELSGLTRNAASFALERLSDEDLSSGRDALLTTSSFRIYPTDFVLALSNELSRFKPVLKL
jgi:SpoVK/Ycf46/Vps4 family AAA+-type ATPase